MERAKTRLPHSHRRLKVGAVRLAVISLLVASTTAGGLLLHHPAKGLPAHVVAEHDCGCSAEVTPSATHPGTRYHYTKSANGKMRLAQAVSSSGDAGMASANALSAGTPSSTQGDIIIPAYIGYALVVRPGEQITLAMNTPLPYGKVPGAGQWFAGFGTITPDGTRYTAPTTLPPFGIDEISYAGETNQPNLHMTILVRDPANPDASVWNSPDEALTYKSFGAGKTGYSVPAKIDAAGYELYIPSPQRISTIKPKHRIEPINPLPPYPNGVPPYNCTPGAPYDVTSSPNWIPKPNYPLITGWTSLGTQTVYVDATAQGQISQTYNIYLGVGYQSNLRVQYRDIDYDEVNYTDHYTCANSGHDWTFTGTTVCERKGIGKIFDPVWMSVIRGWPANGNPVWLPTGCHNL